MLPDEYRIEDEVEWRGIDSAVLAGAVISWAGLFWIGYRTWRLVRRGG